MGNGLYGISTVSDEHPNEDTILDVITRLKFPNITNSNSGTVIEYRARISEKLNIRTTETRLFETKKRNQINIFPIITSRVDREISLYCHGDVYTLKQWTKTIPEDLCETSDINLTLTIDSPLMNTIENIAK